MQHNATPPLTRMLVTSLENELGSLYWPRWIIWYTSIWLVAWKGGSPWSIS